MTSQQNVQNSIAFLFDRPGEPLLTGRDDVSFDVPENFWVRREIRNFVSSPILAGCLIFSSLTDIRQSPPPFKVDFQSLVELFVCKIFKFQTSPRLQPLVAMKTSVYSTLRIANAPTNWLKLLWVSILGLHFQVFYINLRVCTQGYDDSMKENK